MTCTGSPHSPTYCTLPCSSMGVPTFVLLTPLIQNRTVSVAEVLYQGPRNPSEEKMLHCSRNGVRNVSCVKAVARGRIRLLPTLFNLIGWTTLKVVAVSTLAFGGNQACALLYNSYDAMQQVTWEVPGEGMVNVRSPPLINIRGRFIVLFF